MTIEGILLRFDGVKPCGENSWLVRCPVHDDQKQSLRITLEGKKILLYCHAGCDTEAILTAIGCTIGDLFLENDTAKQKPRAVATYEFTTMDGLTVFCDRMEPKGFRWRHKRDGRDVYGLPKDVQVNLYKHEAIEHAEGPVYIVEGVKDAQTLERLGLAATTTPNGGGRGKWKPHHLTPFTDKEVILCPDNDAPGREYAQEAADKLRGIARSVRFLLCWEIWPNLPAKGDVTDLVEHLGDDAREAIFHAELRETLGNVDVFEVAFAHAHPYLLEDG